MFDRSKPKIGCSSSITNRWTRSSSFDVRKMMFEFVRCSIKWCSTHHYLKHLNKVPFWRTRKAELKGARFNLQHHAKSYVYTLGPLLVKSKQRPKGYNISLDWTCQKKLNWVSDKNFSFLLLIKSHLNSLLMMALKNLVL